mgnify:CR=1 FL=1
MERVPALGGVGEKGLKNQKSLPAMLPARRSYASGVAGGRIALQAGNLENKNDKSKFKKPYYYHI